MVLNSVSLLALGMIRKQFWNTEKKQNKIKRNQSLHCKKKKIATKLPQTITTPHQRRQRKRRQYR